MSETSRRITLRDIALECGVSRNTVSLALRNNPTILKSTRFRIHAAAKQLGYVPDPELARLMVRLGNRKKKPGILAELAYVYMTPRSDKKPGHPEYFEPARRFLERNGYRLTPFLLHPNGHSEADLNRIFAARGITGVILAPVASGCPNLNLNWDRLAGVAIGRTFAGQSLPRVDADLLHASQTCVQKLAEAGYKNIGAIIPSGFDHLIGLSSTSGFVGAIIDNGVGAPVILDYSRTQALASPKLFGTWIARHKLDGLVGFDFDFPRLSALARRGSGIPKDLAFAAIQMTKADIGKISGVLPDDTGVGETSAMELLSALQHGVYGEPLHRRLTLILGDWQDGPTVAARPAERARRLVKMRAAGPRS